MPQTETVRLPRTPLQRWFTREMFYDLFPFANLGWGPHKCLPYSYEAFIIASRYFPEFGAGKEGHGFTKKEMQRRDVAAFFAHVIQETGENNIDLYNTTLTTEEANDCFYRGGFFNWFEGGPESDLVAPETREYSVNDAAICYSRGRYCSSNKEIDFWYPCADKHEDEGNSTIYKGCYFGRGPLQLSWNYNYGQFEHFLRTRKINVNLLEEPNLILTKMDPPLAMLASLWFYMTPQPPKPSMHDVMMGNWRPSAKNRRAGYEGSVFGPTSLIINKECGGEDEEDPGGAGESRRIKAFKWFCRHLNVSAGIERTISCRGMLEGFDANPHKYSWQPSWSTMWKAQPCDCEPAPYNGALPYYDPKFYPDKFVRENDKNRLRYLSAMLTCSLCNIEGEFPTAQELEIHIAVDHVRHVPYECARCKYARFPTEYSIRFHYRQTHNLTNAMDPDLKIRCIVSADGMRKQKEVKAILNTSLATSRASNTAKWQQKSKPVESASPPTVAYNEECIKQEEDDNYGCSPPLEIDEGDVEADINEDVADDVSQSPPEQAVEEEVPEQAPAEQVEPRKIELMPCLECGNMTTAQRTSFAYHVNTRHLRREIFRCLGCNKTWLTIARSDIAKHVKAAHNGDESLIEDNRDKYNDEIRQMVKKCFPYKISQPTKTPRGKRKTTKEPARKLKRSRNITTKNADEYYDEENGYESS
ncbi:hypothetical protein QR680_006076 [Steinernema hermaphroditum]|uniref:C2H2-type domain-containing protein n=1 Tax=Steinernema hermaphroditum TaxID=289476 RepID=A0AA39HVK4_9BILA|nr:hypothetical protein QR680_006076 [Steinernema hermaphroditum]